MNTKPPLQKFLQGTLHTKNESTQTIRQVVSNHRRGKDKESESHVVSAAQNQTLKQ
jgi:hypothetical protein